MISHAELLEIGAVVLGGVALIAVLRRGGTTQAAPAPEIIPPTPSNYTNYNQPRRGAYAENSAGVPNSALAANGTGSSSGQPCACGQSSVNFSSLDSFANYLTQQDETIVARYAAEVQAAEPSWMAQFINNTFAPDETAAAEGRFAAMAASS